MNGLATALILGLAGWIGFAVGRLVRDARESSPPGPADASRARSLASLPPFTLDDRPAPRCGHPACLHCVPARPVRTGANPLPTARGAVSQPRPRPALRLVSDTDHDTDPEAA